MIMIKPHHLIDIIKLYGAGIEHFVPDEAFQHDFYRVANEIIANPEGELQLTIYGDDICKPCNRFDGIRCTDPLKSVGVYCDKETYNRELDSRIIGILKLNSDKRYTVRRLLGDLKNQNDIIFKVWSEEDSALTEKRNDLFQKGCDKLLGESN